MVLALKYCGGCSARYDRVELAQAVRERLGSLVEWTGHDDPGAGHVLVIAGCESACVDLKPFAGKTIHLIACEEDLEALIRELAYAARGIGQ